MASPLTLPRWVFPAMLAAVLLVRAQTLGTPVLHIDEQFYLLAGDRTLHGALPFVDVWDRKPVGLFLIYAAIRLLGGDGIWQYQLVSAVFVALTATVIVRLARTIAPLPGALLAGLAYLVWLNLLDGDGGQTPIFYNLLMAGAALIMLRMIARSASLAGGPGVMLLVGLAIQIKPTVVFEGIFFGLVLLWRSHVEGVPLPRLAVRAALWVAAALAPTFLVVAWYWQAGALDAWLYANVYSIFDRDPDPWAIQLRHLAVLAVALGPLIAPALIAPPEGPAGRFIRLWLLVAVVAVVGFGVHSAHYGLPIMLPAAIAAAPFFARWRRSGIALLLVGLIAGQAVLRVNLDRKGTRAQIAAIVATLPAGEPLWVWDAPPILSLLARAPAVTPFEFPPHLNTWEESMAIGVNPLVATRAVLARRPLHIAAYAGRPRGENPRTLALVAATLARDYRVVGRYPLGRRDVVLWRRVSP